MARLKIVGPCRLEGEVKVHGAKNSTLPLLAACLLCGGESVLHNCPQLSDVDITIQILRHLGCKVRREGDTVTVDSSVLQYSDIPDQWMREMRSSIVFLGAILARMGKAELSFPGGCELGPRPIDLHLSALKKLGVQIHEDHGRLHCSVRHGLRGKNIGLSFPSVGATENIMLAAVLAKGTTVITNAACEPEICDLAGFLNACGAQVRGAGTSTIVIQGVERLCGCEHQVIPDRIAAATLLSAAAITGGRVLLRDIEPVHLEPVLPVFEEAGCELTIQGKQLAMASPQRLSPVKNVRTMPYPGFPTDAQAPIMAMACVAEGTSVFVENIFESRYKHVGELTRLGARIKVEGRVAIVEGVPHLSGASVQAADLRGGAALVVAGLAAEGITQVHNVRYIDRGYESLEQTLAQLGANIVRMEESQT